MKQRFIVHGGGRGKLRVNRPLVVSAFGGLVLVMWLAAWSVVGSAERSPELLTERPVADALFQAVVLPP